MGSVTASTKRDATGIADRCHPVDALTPVLNFLAVTFFVASRFLPSVFLLTPLLQLVLRTTHLMLVLSTLACPLVAELLVRFLLSSPLSAHGTFLRGWDVVEEARDEAEILTDKKHGAETTEDDEDDLAGRRGPGTLRE